VLGAVRAGIKTIILPKENAADLEDLPRSRNSLDVHLVEGIGRRLDARIAGGRFRGGHLVFEGDAPIEPKMVSKN